MKKSYSLLLIFLLAYSVTPLNVTVTWEYHDLAGIIANYSGEDRTFTVVSDSELVTAHHGRLSLQNVNGTFGETTLSSQPDSLYAYKIEPALYIVTVTHAPRNDIHYCRYSYTRQRLHCRASRVSPTSTAAFAISPRITIHNQFFVYAVYEDEGYLTHYDVVGNYEVDSVSLPENCVCNSDCLVPVNEPSGQVIVQCEDGTTYLYDLYSVEFLVLPPAVKQVVKSNYQNLYLVAQQAEGLNQDILVEVNITTSSEYASTLPFEGSLASSSNPVSIHDVTVVAVNKTSQVETCYFLRGSEILYFELVKLGTYPVIKNLSLPLGVTPVAIRGKYGSSIIVEGRNSNGSLLIVIEANIPTADEVSPNENVTVNNTNISESHIHPTSTVYLTSTVYPTSCTPSIHHKPHPTNILKPPNTGTDSKNSTASTTNHSDDFELMSFVYGLITGLSPLVVIVLVLCLRHYCRRPRQSYDISKKEDSNVC